MIPFDCINNACLHLLKHKNIQIYLQQMSGEVCDTGSWILNIKIPSLPITPKVMRYNARIMMDHNYYVDCIFEEDDFNPTITCSIDEVAGIKDWEDEDKKQCARFIYMLYEMYKLCTNKRLARMNDPVDDYIFSKTQRIERRL